jgi:hypothetical protein
MLSDLSLKMGSDLEHKVKKKCGMILLSDLELKMGSDLIQGSKKY